MKNVPPTIAPDKGAAQVEADLLARWPHLRRPGPNWLAMGFGDDPLSRPAPPRPAGFIRRLCRWLRKGERS
jgi:hypothetical protein